MSTLGKIKKHHINSYFYADSMQLYLYMKPADTN